VPRLTVRHVWDSKERAVVEAGCPRFVVCAVEEGTVCFVEGADESHTARNPLPTAYR
jgi:hypothetical protein